MSDLHLRRIFPISPEQLFAWITLPEHLLKWWGPEGLHIPDHALDFRHTGPWHSVMENQQGERFHVSGEVTHVDAPRSIGFTWAWHGEDGQRGDESHVTFTIAATTEGSMLMIDHRDLGTEEIASRHEEGWSSTLRKLEAVLADLS